ASLRPLSPQRFASNCCCGRVLPIFSGWQMTEQIWKVDDVFGVSRDVPGNYVTREKVDGKLIDSLTRDHHIVIYGSSKQGKTSLRKHCLQPADYITISCQNKWGLPELHSAILKEAG